MGKSRVIATIALMILMTSSSIVYIVIPTQTLMQRDQTLHSDFWIKTNTVDRVRYHQNLHFDKNSGDIIIVDEADGLMFNDPQAFYEAATKCSMISMTASRPITVKQKSFEDTVF